MFFVAFVVFLLLFGFVCFVMLIFGGIAALFRGGRDPYEEELWEEERHQELCDTIKRHGGQKHLHITDARQTHLYGDRHKHIDY